MFLMFLKMPPVRVFTSQSKRSVLDSLNSFGSELFANSPYKPKVGACFFYSQLGYLSTVLSYVVI